MMDAVTVATVALAGAASLLARRVGPTPLGKIIGGARGDAADESVQKALFRRVAKRCATEMRTTERVGGELGEDKREAPLRSMLSKINDLGLITTDSQSGSIDRYPCFNDRSLECEGWQRAYLNGFMLRDEAWDLRDRLNLEDGIAVMVCEHAPDVDTQDWLRESSPMFDVTKGLRANGEFHTFTHAPTSSQAFTQQWTYMLPETGFANDMETMKLLAPAVVHVEVVDLVWNRHPHMFERVIDALSGRGRPIPEPVNARSDR